VIGTTKLMVRTAPIKPLRPRRQVYLGGEESLEERMHRNRHTRQRNIDDAGFLK
jgi:hypothetical protein